jgi:hypothetical protein
MQDKPTESEGYVLDRLKEIHTDSEAAIVASSNRPNIVSNDFEQLVNIVRTVARTHIRQSERLAIEEKNRQIDYINSLAIIPDDRIADAHKNEINLKAFVHKFIPEQEWVNYIQV